MTRRRELALNLLLSLASIFVCLLVAEIVFRFLPVSTGLRSLPVTAADPVLHFAPNRPFTNSLGWNFYNVVRGRVNNAGFVNDQDYVARRAAADRGRRRLASSKPRWCPMPSWLQGRLAAALRDKFRVYSFAASGAPLSQYLIYAGHAVRDYGARAVVINVVGNDFDESLRAYRRSRLLAIRAGCERRAASAAEFDQRRHADLARPPQRARALSHHQSRRPEPIFAHPLAR